MGKKDKDSVLDDYAKLKNEIIRDREDKGSEDKGSNLLLTLVVN